MTTLISIGEITVNFGLGDFALIALIVILLATKKKTSK